MNSRRWSLFLALTAVLMIPVLVAANDEDDAKRVYLGIRMQRIEGGLADALSIEEDSGILVGQVMDDSPAAKAGIEEGDVIVKIDGTAVGTPEKLGELIRSKSDGEKVNIQLLRDKKTKNVSVTLVEAPEEMRTIEERGPRPGHGPNQEWFEGHEDDGIPAKRGYLGVMTQPLSSELGEYFGVKDGKGALVSEVVDTSPAAKLGLRAGDVITQVDDREIKGPGDLLSAMGEIDQEKAVKVTWVRSKKVRTGTVDVELRDAARGGHDARRFMPRRFDRYLPPPTEMGEMGDMSSMKSEMESLRKELDSLRMELQKMKEDVHRK